MTLSRRSLFAAGGLAPFGVASTPELPQIDQPTYGLRVALTLQPDGWKVYVPDYDAMDAGWTPWRPGFAPQWKLVPLADYLAQVEEVCGVKKETA